MNTKIAPKRVAFGKARNAVRYMLLMRLVCFREARLEAAQTPLSPQLTLLLSYIRLEAETSRHALARLFWPHLAGEYSAKGERKDLNNASVALASLRRATGLEPQEIAGLACDAYELREAFARANYAEVINLYEPNGFLAGLEHSPRLKLAEPLFEWLLDRRAQFQNLAFAAYLNLVEGIIYSHDGTGDTTDEQLAEPGNWYVRQLHLCLRRLAPTT
jgi:hypothetical protein